MSCNPTTTLVGIGFSCDDIPIGGVKRILVERKSALEGLYSVTDGQFAFTGAVPSTVIELEFNTKDAFTNIVEDKTSEQTGVVTNVPVIQVEFPKMDVQKRNAIEILTNPLDSFIAFIELATGEHLAVGWQFGLYGSTVHAQSGTGRTEKNVYQLTLTGEESELSAYLDDTEWAKLPV